MNSHGRQIKITAYGDPTKLGSVDTIRAFLEALVTRLGMRLLADPTMFDVELQIGKLGAEPFEDEGGVTGVAVLSTSHCSIHTWPLREGFLVLDVYSCRDFEPAAVVDHAIAMLGVTDFALHDLTFSNVPPTRAISEPTIPDAIPPTERPPTS